MGYSQLVDAMAVEVSYGLEQLTWWQKIHSCGHPPELPSYYMNGKMANQTTPMEGKIVQRTSMALSSGMMFHAIYSLRCLSVKDDNTDYVDIVKQAFSMNVILPISNGICLK